MTEVRITYQIEALSGVLVGSTADVLSIGLDKSTIRRRRVVPPEKPQEPKIEPRDRRDLPIELRRPKQEPVIPGSTIKGKLRDECERILKQLGWDVCLAPRADTMCPHNEAVKHPPCAICQIFGSPDQQGRLFFSDAPARAELGSDWTRAQAGVSLSRSRRTAQEDRLYYIERGLERTVYGGEIEGWLDDHDADKQLALIIAALQTLPAIGGAKSRGAGATRITITGLDVNRQNRNQDIEETVKKGLEQWRESR